MGWALDRSRWTTHPFYALVILTIACGSIPKGYDEGGFSASVKLDSFVADYNLGPSHWKDDPTGLADRKANITSFNVLGAAFGALFTLQLNDRIGRLYSWRVAVVVWATGLLVQVFSSGMYGMLLVARIWSGLGTGALTVIAPLYLSEIAPARTRGLVVSVYMVILLAVLAMGFFINYAARLHMPSTRTQYRLVQSIPLIPVGLAFLASFHIPETPRYLLSKQLHDEARIALALLRGKPTTDPEVEFEFTSINHHLRAQSTPVSHWAALKETQSNPNYRQRFWLLMTMQTIAQWTGGNGITYYMATIFEYAGVVGTEQALISSGVYGIVKLVFTMAFTWGLIDYIGRRRCALTGLTLQLAAHIYMAAYMGLTPSSTTTPTLTPKTNQPPQQQYSPYSSTQSDEIFPTRIRNISYGLSMSLHWFFQFAVVRVTPSMFVELRVWGAYVFWACVCFVGLLVLGVWMPETRGVPVERMREVFEGVWYMRWAGGLKHCDRGDGEGVGDGEVRSEREVMAK
ncbi:general substrate transporter [Aspergillus campestris IBT 28561]|uniref:General substrate transporter n=1 Tax=Aspergillus campestris (strain IBT 28561) TaxID=1392248 RepID=A0A2I1DH57_ASPC2|nr:general substrate transporter [Aspergillus campestris IBT 28561]PKY09203.1 general substrate transporter [Aspergillus campestris IBT 28561]